MKVTPIEIKQQTFEITFRGYDKTQVHQFLEALALEWELLIIQNKEYKTKIHQAEQEIKRLREVEATLVGIIKNEEQKNIYQINKPSESELILKDTNDIAEKILQQAREKAKEIVTTAENEAESTIEQSHKALAFIKKNYTLIQNHKDYILKDLRNLYLKINDGIEIIEQLNPEPPLVSYRYTDTDTIHIQKEELLLEKKNTIPSDPFENTLDVKHTDEMETKKQIQKHNPKTLSFFDTI
ncbi:MAG: DivIVA domain-containing protein [Chitinophagaceae bacterium]|nr:DivIVA domain-containing protein [Chitinophagaceae bacterium]